MAKYYGYCYDVNGKFTETIPLKEKPIFEKQTFHREEQKEVVTEEKLCEVHQENEEGKFECPDCVMRNVSYETVQVPYEEDVVVGYEPDIPINCTLEPCPDLIFEPVFKNGKWVKLKPDLPPVEPTVPPEKNEIESLKEQMAAMKKVLDELLLGGM